MSKVGDLEPDPSIIGTIAKPPFARLPDPARMFSARAERLRMIAGAHDLGAYLLFLAGLSELQARLVEALPAPDMPPADVQARAHEHAMPPLDRNAFTADAAFAETLGRLLPEAAAIDMPEPARAALERLRALDAPGQDETVRNVLADSIPVEALAEHVFVAAALQVHFARLAQRLDAAALKQVGDGVCPSCGAPPVASAIVAWPGAVGTRFCTCSLCGTRWNFVRSRCTICGSTDKIGFQEIADAGGLIKAETCDACRTYTKVLQQQKDPRLDPVADDVASLALDLLVRELGYRRGNVNPFLLGY